MHEHETEVMSKSLCHEMPAKRSIEKPDFGILWAKVLAISNALKVSRIDFDVIFVSSKCFGKKSK